MNIEINKEDTTPKNDNAKAKTKKAGLKNKKKKNNFKNAKPSVAYSEEELLEVEKKPFWNAIHSAQIAEVLDDGLWVDIANPEGGQLRVFVGDGELIDKSSVAKNEKIEIYLEDALPEQNQEERPIIGSEIKAKDLKLCEKAREAHKNHESVYGYVISPIKGGYSLALFANNRDEAEKGYGLRAFLPLGQTTLRRNQGLSEQDEHLIEVQISELDLARGNIVVSRRELLVEERKKGVEEFFAQHKIGDEVSGQVTALMPYGVFVNLGPVDGFLHISDISWDKKPRLQSIVPVGKEISAQIIEIDAESKKVKLSLKGLNSDPWQNIDKSFKPGTEVEGTVVAFADFGAFVKLKDGVEGLIHVAEISWTRVKHPSQKFKIGDTVKAAVLRVDKASRRISLSTKALELSPVERLSGQFPVGTVIKTKVASIHDFGVFVELDEESQGLVPRSEISWVRSDEPVEKQFNVGQEIEVAVIGYDSGRQRVSCSIKRLTDDPWEQWRNKFKRGSSHKVKVIRAVRAGLECQLDGDLTGFCPKSQMAEGADDNAKINVKVGDMIDVVVTAFDPARHRVSISQKALVESETKQAYQSYLSEQGQGGGRTTLGDAFKNINLNKK